MATYAPTVPRPTSPGSFVVRTLESWRRRHGTPPPAPDPTGFYRAGDPGEGPRAEVLASEPMPPPAGAVAWRVRYRTLDAAGRPVAASMALAAPAGLAPRPRPLVVWVHGAVGVAPGCAPSRAGFEAWYAEDLLRHGIVVAAPDLTGLGIEGVPHPYLHGTTAGQSVLDAARAAAAVTATGAGGTVSLAGHSAGGHAVLWANELAAGDDGAGLEVAVVVPIAPVGDLTVAMTSYARTPGMAAFPVQLAATWPGVEPVAAEDVLTPAAIERLDHLQHDRIERLGRVFAGNPARWVCVDGFATPSWSTALQSQSAGHRQGAGPVLVVHGADDVAVQIEWSEALVELLGATGQRAELRAYKGADHMRVGDAARADVVGRIVDAMSS
jgi:dienelactone hydrolase